MFKISEIKFGLVLMFLILGQKDIYAKISLKNVKVFPLHQAKNVNIDTYFQLTFPSEPKLNNSGKIRIYNAEDNSLVDELDLSIPPGPKNTRTLSPYSNFIYPNLPDSVYTVNKPDLNTSHQYQRKLYWRTTTSRCLSFLSGNYRRKNCENISSPSIKT